MWTHPPGPGVYSSNMTFQSQALPTLPPNLVLSPWIPPQMPETKPRGHPLLPSSLSLLMPSSSSYGPMLLLPFSAGLLERTISTISTFSTPVLAWADSNLAATCQPRGHQQLSAASSLPLPEKPCSSCPRRYPIPLFLSTLSGCSILGSSSSFLSRISNVWNYAGLSSWSSSTFPLLSL